MGTTADPELEAIIREFLIESRENLLQFETTLLEAEAAPSAPALASLFRSIHSIKGSCGFLGFARTEALVHAGETLLGRLRDGRLELTPPIATTLLRMVDAIRGLLASIDATGQEAETEHATLRALLERHAAAEVVPPEGVLDELPPDRDPERAHLVGADGKIRVDVALLDRLMNLVGELVLTRNQLARVAMAQPAAGLQAPTQRLSLVTGELQAAVMRTRMQRIDNVWNRLPRVVRDLSHGAGKQVRLVLEGGGTELDKTVLEAIQDPITHLVRNAIDHGLEPAEARRARAKPLEGTLALRAYHEGGLVHLEISDDGGGIDLDVVRRRAIDQRLITAERAAQLDEREALALIFLPGFSTAAQVTTISGRGVGMDVVKTNIEKIGGSVDLQSRAGEGTTVRIKIPLTLAIVPALIVIDGGARYAIPQGSLLEVVRFEGEQAARAVETVQGAPVFRLRGKLLPLAYLGQELGGAQASGVAADGSLTIVVLQADDRSFGLVVDELRDTEEIVVKPMWGRLKAIGCFAGATVMGDGVVALILDAIGLAQRVGVLAQVRQRSPRAPEVVPEARAPERQVLLCRIGLRGRLAIPLELVARLEELPVALLEEVGGVDVAQIRGQILRVVHLGRVLEERRRRPRGDEDDEPPAAAPATAELLPLVVCATRDRVVGLAVDQILDIVTVGATLQDQASRAGILGSMIVQDRITELLDVDQVLHLVDPERGVIAVGRS